MKQNKELKNKQKTVELQLIYEHQIKMTNISTLIFIIQTKSLIQIKLHWKLRDIKDKILNLANYNKKYNKS